MTLKKKIQDCVTFQKDQPRLGEPRTWETKSLFVPLDTVYDISSEAVLSSSSFLPILPEFHPELFGFL